MEQSTHIHNAVSWNSSTSACAGQLLTIYTTHHNCYDYSKPILMVHALVIQSLATQGLDLTGNHVVGNHQVKN